MEDTKGLWTVPTLRAGGVITDSSSPLCGAEILLILLTD